MVQQLTRLSLILDAHRAYCSALYRSCLSQRKKVLNSQRNRTTGTQLHVYTQIQDETPQQLHSRGRICRTKELNVWMFGFYFSELILFSYFTCSICINYLSLYLS